MKTTHVHVRESAIATKLVKFKYTDPRYGNGVHERASEWQKVAETGTLEMEIDLEALAKWMASRAMSTKSGISKLQDGMIVMRVVKRAPLVALEAPAPVSHETYGVAIEILGERNGAKPLPFPVAA